jgi:hypothetical protein
LTDFDLGRVFDGAISPINTLLHLTPLELALHLERTAHHLVRGGAYLVQVGLMEPEPGKSFAGSHWEASRGETVLHCDWIDEELDFAAGVSRQRSRIEVVSGDRAGDVLEEIHELTLWSPVTWAHAVEVSPFDEIATYDGGQKANEWPRVAREATGGLLWHELRL